MLSALKAWLDSLRRRWVGRRQPAPEASLSPECAPASERRAVASYEPREGWAAVRLRGGPWDGGQVWVSDSSAGRVGVKGPRHGDHRTHVTHLYELRGGNWEFVGTEVVPLSAWSSWNAPP